MATGSTQGDERGGAVCRVEATREDMVPERASPRGCDLEAET